MKFSSFLIGLAGFAGATGPLLADVLDDANLSVEQFLRNSPPGMGSGRGTFDMSGVPLSAEHEAQLLAHAADPRAVLIPGFVARLLESRGDFERALARVDGGMSLERVRLLLRLNREAEARAVLTNEAVAKLAEGHHPQSALVDACRPLEDAEQWELLDKFLAILRERMTAPRWQKAIWLEELDLAWHRGQLPQLMAAVADDKLRLCIYQSMLGRATESEALARELLASADKPRLVILLEVLPESVAARDAGLGLWMNPDLSAAERSRLWERLSIGNSAGEFVTLFPQWLAKGGDPLPIADSIVKSWVRHDGNMVNVAALKELHQRAPGEPRFTFLLARALANREPERAAELFASLAAMPLQRDPDPKPGHFSFNDLLGMSENDLKEPALTGLRGLGYLNRQDKVKEILDRHPDWQGLPAWDRARHLATARMDRDFAALVLAADPALPENEWLPGLLAQVLRERGRTRVIPPEIYRQVAAKMPALVIGSGKPQRVRENAVVFTALLADSQVDLPAVRAALTAMLEEAKPLSADLQAQVDEGIRSGASQSPRLRTIYPVKAAENRRNFFQDSISLGAALRITSPPEIQRLSGMGRVWTGDLRAGRGRGRLAGNKEYASLFMLKPWAANASEWPLGRRDEKQPIFGLMKHYPPGHARRIMADLMVASDALHCPDEALKAESTAAVEELVAGKLALKGTELFRYATLAARRAPEAELKAILDNVKAQPPVVGLEFLRALQDSFEDRQGYSLAARILTPERAPQRDARPARDEDMEKLRQLVRGQLSGSPEAQRLARVVLDKAVALEVMLAVPGSHQSNASMRAGLAIHEAVAVLDLAGMFAGWRQEAQAKLIKDGTPELHSLRTLRVFAQASREKQDRRDGERRILELDPRDELAAAVLVDPAVAEGDDALLDRCVRALGLNAFSRADTRALLARYEGGREGVLIDLIEGSKPQAIGEPGVRVHGFLLGKQPALAARFRAWLEKHAEAAMPRRALAEQLLAAGDREAAAGLFLRWFVVPRSYDGAPWVFPPKPGTPNVRLPYESPPSREEEIGFLITSGLATTLLREIDARDEPTSMESLRLRLGVTPDVATFDKYAVPYLATLGDTMRRGILNRLKDAFEEIPGAGGLRLRLAEQSLLEGDSWASFATAANTAARQPGGAGTLAKLWTKLAEEMRAEDASRREGRIREAQGMFLPMLLAADDATWENYWKWRSSDEQPLPGLGNGWPDDSGFDLRMGPARLRQVLPRLMAELPPQGRNEHQIVGLVGAALETGDLELIAKSKTLLPENLAGYGKLCDLAAGDPAAVSPLVDADEGADGVVTVGWNLVTLRRLSREDERKVEVDVPLANFSKLDGKFDVTILGGPRRDQLDKLVTVPAAAVTGNVRLAAGQRPECLGLLVTQVDGGAVRWSPVVRRDPQDEGPKVEITGAQLTAKGFSRMARPGPGGQSAWQLRTVDEEMVEVARAAWEGGGKLSVSAWTAGSGKFSLFCYDAAGKRTKEFMLWTTPQAIPSWQLVSTGANEEKEEPPAGTVRIVLAVRSGHPEGIRDFAFSGLSFRAGGDTVLPEGFRKLGRVGGYPQSLAVTPDGSRVAVGLPGGRLAVMETASGQVREVDLDREDVESEESAGNPIVKVLWVDERRLVALDSAGVMHLGNADELKFSSEAIMGSSAEGWRIGSFDLTRDGKWLVWLHDDTTLAVLDPRADGKSKPREIKIPPTRQVFQTAEGLIFMGDAPKYLLLKFADLPAGQPVEIARPDDAAWQEGPALGGWLKDLNTESGTTGWKEDEGRKSLCLPHGTSHAASADQSVYYADKQGVVVKVAPPP